MRLLYSIVIIGAAALLVKGLDLEPGLAFGLMALLVASDTRYITSINLIALETILKERNNDKGT